MKKTQYHMRPTAMAILSIIFMASSLTSTSCRPYQKKLADPGSKIAKTCSILMTAGQTGDPNFILIETLFLECSDGGQQLMKFLKNESLVPSGQRVVTVNSEQHYKLVPDSFNEAGPRSLEVDTEVQNPSVSNTYFLTGQQKDHLKSLSQVKVVASPRIKIAYGKPAQMHVISEKYYMIPDSPKHKSESAGKLEMIENGMKLDIISHTTNTEDEVTIEYEMEIIGSVPAKLPRGTLPIVTRRKSRNAFTMNISDGMLLVGPVSIKESKLTL